MGKSPQEIEDAHRETADFLQQQAGEAREAGWFNRASDLEAEAQRERDLAEMSASEKHVQDALTVGGTALIGGGWAISGATRQSLNAAQMANLERTLGRIASAYRGGVKVTHLKNGMVRIDYSVPGKVPGSFAQYSKTVDKNGVTLTVTKTTVDPKGKVVHIKDKSRKVDPKMNTHTNGGGAQPATSDGGGFLGALKSLLGL